MLDENNNVVFPYQVNTIMPITGLSIGSIMVPSTVKLTKEDVTICIKKAPVFRRFQNGKLVRVTVSSIDRLHNENLMTDKEYEDFLDKQADKRGKVSEVAKEVKKEKPVVEEPVKEEAPVVEEPVEEIPVEEVKVEEADTAMDEIVDQTEEPVAETTEDIINDEGISEDVTESVDSEESSKNNQKNRYNNKKKHNR